MKKVLIDCGSNVGNSIDMLVSALNITDDWTIECFEPTPNLVSILKNKFKNTKLNLSINECAIYDKNENVSFSICNENSEGSSVECLMSEGVAKILNHIHYRKHDNIITVKAIRLVDVLKKYNDEDQIVIKLDIEGSEFKVVKDLLNSDQTHKIKKIFIEWHAQYVKNESEHSVNELINKLKDKNIEVYNWF